MPNYPDAATLLITWAKATLGVVNACHEVPTNLVGVLKDGPIHVVERFGGADRLPGLDEVRIAVDTYGVGRDGTLARAEDFRRALRLLQGRSLSGVAFSRVSTISAPTRRPYDSRSVVLVGATYQLTLHSAF